jgi:hypothetical protein
MYAPVKRKGAGRPSSRGALVDVEVDRCTDENSASNLKYRLSFDKASSTKTEDPSINQISDSSQIASRNPFLSHSHKGGTFHGSEAGIQDFTDLSRFASLTRPS